MKPGIAILLLAAGESSRMEPIKQLLAWGDKPLLQHCYDQCLASGVGPVYVVLGAYSEEIRQHLGTEEKHWIEHKNWQRGMGSTIAYGVRSILKDHPDLDGILVALADQPLIQASYYNALIALWKQKGRAIASTNYKGRLGVPAIFGSSFFEDLKLLDGPPGARLLLNSPGSEVHSIAANKDMADIDTLEEYEQLIKKYIIS